VREEGVAKQIREKAGRVNAEKGDFHQNNLIKQLDSDGTIVCESGFPSNRNSLRKEIM